MNYNPLFIFVEGPDDARFVKKVLLPVLKDYDHVQVQEYAEEKHEKINSFIESLNSSGWKYIFLCDMDRNPCVTQKIQKELRKYRKLGDREGIFVVIKEIESWYLAGISDETSKSFGLKALANTDDITKEMFDEIKPSRFKSRVDFMSELLKYFSIDLAKSKNASFNYIASKLALV